MKISELFENVTWHELDAVEKFADELWHKLGIDIKFTHHFMDQLNNDRNSKPISADELIRIFKKEYESNGLAISKLDNVEAVMKDLLTLINIPFVMSRNKHGKELVAKTIMRKSNFKTSNPSYAVNETSRVKLSTDPEYFGATVNDANPLERIVSIPVNKIDVFEPDDKFDDPQNAKNLHNIRAALKKGAKLPPILVRRQGQRFQVLDGHHRFKAYRMAGLKEIPARIVSKSNVKEL